MIRQQFDALEGARAPKQGRRPLEMRVAVVYAGDDGQPDDERLRAFAEHARMAQDGRVVHARPSAVRRAVDELDIHHYQIDFRHHLGENFVGAAARGFNAGMQPFERINHRAHERPLHRRFAAGERHAAARTFENCTVAQKPRGERAAFPFRAHDAPQPRLAYGHARPARDAGMMRADARARAAVRAGRGTGH